MGGAAGAGDDHLEALGPGALGEGDHALRRAMGRDDARVIGDAERVERLGGVAHRRPVGLAAHDDGDGRRRQAAESREAEKLGP